VVDVTGSARALATSIALVKTMGTIVCGGLVPDGQLVNLSTNALVRKEARFLGVWTHGFEDTEQSLVVAAQGKYPLEKAVSHEYPLEEADLALRVMSREVADVDPIKVAIRP
jgi:threonine dehydrogenase-like Zn-dependent dehydrogenase